MRRAFVVMTTIKGIVLGLLVALSTRLAIESLTANFLGVIVACLYLGVAFNVVRTP